MAKKDSFILYTEQKAVIDKLTDEQAGKLIKAIYEYVQNGEMPELDTVLDLVITPFKTVLDKDKESYERVCKARAEAGAKGGKQKKQMQTNESKDKQKKQMQTKDSKSDDNDNEYDNDLKKNNKKKKYGENENVKFTDEEYEKVKLYFPDDYEKRIQNLDDYIQMTGKKYKDYFATLKNWAKKENYKPPDSLKKTQKEEYKAVDLSQLTNEEYDMLVKKKISIEELIKKGRINV